MKFSLDTYRETGRRAAWARVHGDEPLYEHYRQSKNAMLRAERPEDRRSAESAYRRGYTSTPVKS